MRAEALTLFHHLVANLFIQSAWYGER
jgi:hypothetical protein